MTHLLVILFILGCIGYLYLKANVVKSFSLVITSLFAAIASFGFYEVLAQFLIGRITGRFDSLVPWLHALSFLMIFIAVYAIIQAVIIQLTRQQIDFGKKAELITKIIAGIITGFILAGVALVALALAPLPAKFPYQRFDPAKPNIQKSGKFLPDGFLTWLFSAASDGSLSPFTSNKSFAVIHPDFIDQIHLNKIGIGQKIPTTSFTNELVLPPESPVWFAPDLKDTAGNSLSKNPDSSFIIVRVGIKRTFTFRTGLLFNIAQIRLICVSKEKASSLKGPAYNIFPIGYLTTTETVKLTNLNDKFELSNEDLNDNLPQGMGKWIDFVFEVQNDLTPAMLEFRQNCIVKLPAPVTADKAPQVVPFIPASQCARNIAEIEPSLTTKVFGVTLTAKFRLLDGLSLEINSPQEFIRLIKEDFNSPPRFGDNLLEYAKLVLKIENVSAASSSQKLSDMLKIPEGYSLVSLKCNNPSLGSHISANDLTVLTDLAGNKNYPVGLIASAKTGLNALYQFEFCSVASSGNFNGLQFDEKGNVSKSFTDNIWIAESREVDSISEFYLLYLIKNNTIITKVQLPDSQDYQTFKGYQGFIVN